LYGATSGLLHNVREYWQELQWVEDKIVIDRLRRRPDRVGLLLDVGGMSGEDSWLYCEEVRRRLYRDQYFDPQINELSSLPTAWGEHRDIVVPTGGDNRTQLVNLPSAGSQGPYDDLVFVLRRYFGSLKFPPAMLGLDLGDTIDRSVPLEKQDITFADNCSAPQKVFLQELTRAAIIHLAWLNIDARLDSNQFSLMMMPVSAYKEMERKDLINMRFDLLERALQLGQDYQWDMEFWARYVMTEYARMPDELVNTLLKNPQAAEAEASIEDLPSEGQDLGGDMQDLTNFGLTDSVKRKNDDRYKRLMEALEKNPKVRESLVFFNGGGGMASSREVRLPLRRGKSLRDQRKDAQEEAQFHYKQLSESAKWIADRQNFKYQEGEDALIESQEDLDEKLYLPHNGSFKERLYERVGKRAQARAQNWREAFLGA
jgi:hypothetical protein